VVVLVPTAGAEAEEILARTRQRGHAALLATGVGADEAWELIRAQHARLIPEGVATAQHRFVRIESTDGERLGECWFGPLYGSGDDWYVFDIELDEGRRGRGLGRQAMRAVADECRAAGARRLGLSVATGNTRARAACDAVGFRVAREDATSAEMWLDLTS